MVFVFKVIRVFLKSNYVLQQCDTFRKKYFVYIKLFLFPALLIERIHSNHTDAQTLAMHFSKQVTSVLMEDIRMEENGNCNMFITKGNTKEDSIIGFFFPRYDFIVSDVNSVLRRSMVYCLNQSLMVGSEKMIFM